MPSAHDFRRAAFYGSAWFGMSEHLNAVEFRHDASCGLWHKGTVKPDNVARTRRIGLDGADDIYTGCLALHQKVV